MFRENQPRLIVISIATFFIVSITFVLTEGFGEQRNIPEFTNGILDNADLDFTGHILVITNRGRYYPSPDLYCGSNEMLVYEAVVIHPSGGIITTVEVGIPAIMLNEELIPKVEVWPGTRFEVVYVLNCEARGYPFDPRQLILELKKF